MVRAALDGAVRAGLPAALFAGVRGNPVWGDVAAGLDAFRAHRADGVIAFGGGSALDAGKAVALMTGQTRPIWDFEDVGDNWRRVDPAGIVPVVAVPTTAGSGSEVGRASVITHEATREKKIIFHPRMLPGIVVSDPELTVGLSAGVTAATGFDAFAHRFEAFCAPGFHPMAGGMALEGMRLVSVYLPRAYDRGDDLEARCTRSRTHRRHLRHAPRPHERGAAAVRHAVQPRRHRLEFRRRLGIPGTLADLGVPDGRAEDIGRMAEADPSAAGNPAPVNAAALAAIFRDAVAGRPAGEHYAAVLRDLRAGVACTVVHPADGGATPGLFDALAVHVDEVAALPPGAVVLASNDLSGVQAVEIRAGRGSWRPGSSPTSRRSSGSRPTSWRREPARARVAPGGADELARPDGRPARRRPAPLTPGPVTSSS